MVAFVKKVINVGAAPNDDTGDTLRQGGIDSNDNYTAIFDQTAYEIGGALAVTYGASGSAVFSDTITASAAGAHTLTRTGASDALIVQNSNASPFGILVDYTTAAPNGTGNAFATYNDTVGIKLQFRSNGGIANFQSNDVDLSDETTKNIIGPTTSMWETVKAWNIVDFQYKDQTDDKVNIGVIAQNMQKRFVDSTGEDGLLRVYNKDVNFAAIEVIQELMERVEALEANAAK